MSNSSANTNTYNQPQPHIHPRLPKVVTVTNSVALVVEYHPENIVLYLFHLSKFEVIPVQCHSQLPEIKLGSWVIVGLYQNGRIASICPKPLIANPQPTKIDESGNVMIFCTVSDGLHSGTDVGSKETLLNAMANKAEPNTAIWMKWVGIDKLKETSDNKVWEVSEIGKTESSDVHDFSEVEYRSCLEFARSRKRSEEVCPFPHATNMFVARHIGVIMEHNQDKNTLGVWSVGLTFDDVHNTIWPMEFNKTIQKMVPEPGISVGQWINFDTTIELAEQMTSRSFRQSNKVTIHEFVRCSTPKGIAVSQIGKNVKIILTETYIMSTGHPLVYEIRDFGYILAPLGSLISGEYMQLVLERVTCSLRKKYGFVWKVISSEPFSTDTEDDKKDLNGLSSGQHESISFTIIFAREKLVLSTLDHGKVDNRYNEVHVASRTSANEKTVHSKYDSNFWIGKDRKYDIESKTTPSLEGSNNSRNAANIRDVANKLIALTGGIDEAVETLIQLANDGGDPNELPCQSLRPHSNSENINTSRSEPLPQLEPDLLTSSHIPGSEPFVGWNFFCSGDQFRLDAISQQLMMFHSAQLANRAIGVFPPIPNPMNNWMQVNVPRSIQTLAGRTESLDDVGMRVVHHQAMEEETERPDGEPYDQQPSRNSKAIKRSRVNFTEEQLTMLEAAFVAKQFPNYMDREELSKAMGISEMRVQHWFQNRRAKKRKESSEEVDNIRK